MGAVVQSFFDRQTATVSHVVHAGPGSVCAVIDAVHDFDIKSGRRRTDSADQIVAFVTTNRLRVDWILETHIHADHLSAAPYLKEKLGGRIGVGERVREVQRIFKGIFNAEAEFATDGSQFDHLFTDGEAFTVGDLKARVMHVPGHTPACVAFLVEDTVFVGDTLFLPDVGTARCDFPGGDAGELYRSIRRLLDLPGETRMFVCHDYPPSGREPAWETTVAEQRRSNIHVRDGVSEADFVALRTGRDKTLEMPALLLPSVQCNMRAGHLPPAEADGVRYLKIPVDRL
ncbi:MBL fold metallo-hydrolase [Azospirillum sp.]|uniref:MBL fold metallo-hydrolase n=1 Tax=Azospirillum sp. TaxID=34012 RepID=UPI002D4CE326|nr:MBL fold metallo-hydrolase [Azospirillum sp.]HYD64098.1 MBL fold metallo-hydrolase [Azospirillum sp.]